MDTKVTLLHFNDFHRRLSPLPNGNGGAARLVGELRQLKAENPNSLTLNLGDVAGDNSTPGPNQFEPVAKLFNRAQVDLLSLGNHEFEDPTGSYETLQKGLIQPFQGQVLCANVTDEAGKLLPNTLPYTIRQLAGINIAFIGVVTQDLTSRVFPAAGAGLHTLPLRATLEAMVDEMRGKGADAVVVMAHENISEMTAITEAIPGIDVMLAAHDHRGVDKEVLQSDETPAYLAESDAYGENVGEVNLYFDATTHRLKKIEGQLHTVDASSPSDPEAEKIVAEAPVQERAPMPGKKSREKAIRLDGFDDLAKWFVTKGEAPSPSPLIKQNKGTPS